MFLLIINPWKCIELEQCIKLLSWLYVRAMDWERFAWQWLYNVLLYFRFVESISDNVLRIYFLISFNDNNESFRKRKYLIYQWLKELDKVFLES